MDTAPLEQVQGQERRRRRRRRRKVYSKQEEEEEEEEGLFKAEEEEEENIFKAKAANEELEATGGWCGGGFTVCLSHKYAGSVRSGRPPVFWRLSDCITVTIAGHGENGDGCQHKRLERLAGKVPLNVPGATMAAISQRATKTVSCSFVYSWRKGGFPDSVLGLGEGMGA